jgi:hypothetical protein
VVSEATSLPILFPQLDRGGVIMISGYGQGLGRFADYDPVIATLDADMLWLPSGQCAIIKR